MTGNPWCAVRTLRLPCVAGKTQPSERRRSHPDRGEENPNGKGVIKKLRGLKEAIGSLATRNNVNLFRHVRGGELA